jgi:predicted nuclease of predicted toxin-antitoxin system
MKFLLDQDVYALTRRFLRDFGHDVITAADIGSSQAADETLLTMAHEQARIFVTRDRDFGGLVSVRGCGAGMISLRLQPSTLQAVHEELARVLQSYTDRGTPQRLRGG